MGSNVTSEIAQQLRLREQQVDRTLAMLSRGYTVAFIARYRKETTGGADRKTILTIVELNARLTELQNRKKAVLEAIREQGKLTPDIEKAVTTAGQLWLVEDLYLPFRPQRHTAAMLARNRGLEPLAERILTGVEKAPIDEVAANFIRHDRDVHTTDDAVSGASHIIAEDYSTSARLRQKVRDILWADGILRSSKGSSADEHLKEFRDYFNFSEQIRNLPPHRVLAVNRGERKKALKVVIEVPMQELVDQCADLVVPTASVYDDFLRECLADALTRLIIPSISREVRRELTQRAELHAIDVFASNLRGILMSPPVRGVRVLAVDPGFRTGCKVAALDVHGELLGETIIYPHEPQKRWADAKDTLVAAVQKYEIDVVAIGNGTGCHETEKLVSEVIGASKQPVKYALVSEAGASAYAAGDLAKEEFPNLDAALRGTVSIGRRLQDPISEFVKVDPRCIGVGLYQHDVDQNQLKEHLDRVVYDCINEVGADLNRANLTLLSKISGLDVTLARAIIQWRKTSGPFTSREQLKQVPGIDDLAFQQSAGFLRVFDGENPLDRTPIHPESYAVVDKLLARFGYALSDMAAPGGLPRLRQKLQGLSLETLAEEMDVGIPTLSDILHCLEYPDHDPRDASPPPLFKSEMMRLEDLKPGMWLKGTVRNVVDFGAFVDIGVREDGLVHVSQFSSKYIKNPVDFVHVGQTVDVRVMSIDHDRRRIALSMIPDDEAANTATPSQGSAQEPQGSA
ncbi:MAG: RNA-binding transcriptional accessory protein [Planctomycetes bacterium]|nr:RNA-binding transcriptional accessory protein [Planctomycetota bacterium]